MAEVQKSAAVLEAERNALENQMALATSTHRPQVVEIDGKKVIVIDEGRYSGRRLVPLEPINSAL